MRKALRAVPVVIHFHGFSLGVKMHDGGRDLKIVRPLHWFKEERAARHAALEGTR